MAAENPNSAAPNPPPPDADADPSDVRRPPPPSPKLEAFSSSPDHASSSTPPSAQQETLAGPSYAPPPPVAVAVPDCRSFSQLLAGAMASPAGSPRGITPILAVPVDGAVPLPMIAVPCFLAPAALLDSPNFKGQFAMTHQAVLATVTAQAQMQLQAAHPSSSPDILPISFPQPIVSTISPVPLQQMPPRVHEGSVCTPRAEQAQLIEQKPQSAQMTSKMNPDDGYNWRKYGQKQVKSSENSRSYYKCTTTNCSAKKKVERCPDGRVTEVMYRGQHSHNPPQQTRYSRERMVRSTGPVAENEILQLPSVESNESDPSTSKMEHNSGNETPERQLFCSSDCEGDAAIKTDEDIGDEPDPKRRLSESIVPYSPPVLKTFREPRIVVQTASDVGRVSDGYRWRKYGQKIVKGNPNPRSYYRCTYNGCPVRKHVERASDDAKSIVISYEGKHNHDLPGLKSSSDPPTSPRVPSATAATPGEQLQSSDSLLKITSRKALELGGEKVLESAQALLSIGCDSSAEEDVGGADPQCMKPPLLNENPAAVPVQNS